MLFLVAELTEQRLVRYEGPHESVVDGSHPRTENGENPAMLSSALQSVPRSQLEHAATQFLLAQGCTPDGRKVEEVDHRQVAFDRRVQWTSKGDYHNWY